MVPPRAFFGKVAVIINDQTFSDINFKYVISDIQVSTIAGSTDGYADGNGSAAQFSFLRDIDVDKEGNFYIADGGNHLIRKMSTDLEVITLAGKLPDSDGQISSTELFFPLGLAVDSKGNVYVADGGNDIIRKITPSGSATILAGKIQMYTPAGFADGVGENALFHGPWDVAVDADDNLYVADAGNHSIRKITPDAMVTTLAKGADGKTDADSDEGFKITPLGVTVDKLGNTYFADGGLTHKIGKIDVDEEVSTIAGGTLGYADGVRENSAFSRPSGLGVDLLGNIYVSDMGNNRIRKIDTEGNVITIAGGEAGYVDGSGEDARFNLPVGMYVDDSFTIYLTDANNHKIRKITQE